MVLTGRKPDKLAKVEQKTRDFLTDPSATIISVVVDITIESDVQNLYTQVQKTFGRSADTLVNNGGPSSIPAPLGQVPWDDFTNTVNGHFLGTALMSKYFVSSQSIPEDPVGTIVFITSGLSGVMIPGTESYSIAKLAGQRLMEYLDTEYPRLRTFSLSPGIIKTEMTVEMFEPYSKDHPELPGMWTVYLSQERADFLRGGFVAINWDVKELEENKAEIVEKKLLKINWMPARFGQGGHPFGE